MKDKDSKNRIQPNEKAGRDVNNRKDIPKHHTGVPKSGMESDLGSHMGASTISSRDVDTTYGKERGALNDTRKLHDNASGNNIPSNNVYGVSDSPKEVANKTKTEHNQFGNDIADKNLGKNLGKKSGSGPSHT